jgi:hypothetical protein
LSQPFIKLNLVNQLPCLINGQHLAECAPQRFCSMAQLYDTSSVLQRRWRFSGYSRGCLDFGMGASSPETVRAWFSLLANQIHIERILELESRLDVGGTVLGVLPVRLPPEGPMLITPNPIPQRGVPSPANPRTMKTSY